MSNKTVRENRNATVRERQNASATLRKEQTAAGMGGASVSATFQGYRIVRQLPTKGSEADIFVVEKDAAQYILKQYRYGINPKRDILLDIKALSESHPHEFVRLFDTDFDPASGRWYEIQEYVPNGSLQSLMADRSLITGVQQATFFNDVARELADALHALHQNNLLHLDLKPSNILLRSVHPLNLVLIDFGIATALDADMSKKFTQVRGTPMYQSPESYSGGMGRPADWWGLGMILLEIAAGVHPFKGLSNNIIAYAIATEPVPIPENLDAGRKELLCGLLTRDPEKRWSYDQVVRWLSGERSIPQHFETALAMQAQPAGNAGLKPLKFMDRQYQSLAELAAAFLKDEQAWEKGREFLMRGYVKQWLEKNDEFDAIIDMDKVMSGPEEPDEKLFRFAQRFGGDMPFAFGGHLITLQNLLLFAGKVLKRQPVTAMEQKIADSIADGILLSCLDFYKQQGRASETMQDLWLVLKTVEGKSQEQVVKMLDIFMHPKNHDFLLNRSNKKYLSNEKRPSTSSGNMTFQEIAQKISAFEEQERQRLEQEKKEQERKERERKEQERIEQEKRREQERREQERREQERRAQERRRAEERKAQEIRDSVWTNSLGMEFVLIPGGTFWMGSNNVKDAGPCHKVTIARPFYLGKYPVTQAQWEAVMGMMEVRERRGPFGWFGQQNNLIPNNPSHFKGADRPVENVSWNDVQDFIRKLNERENHNRYRLPTEAEWEYACRAGSTGRYCFSDDKSRLKDYAWYKGNSEGRTHPVGQKKPNAWGLYDMHGNVFEWVQDWYGSYGAGAVVDPRGPDAGVLRVLRGGSWRDNAESCRSANRDGHGPDFNISSFGFRLALSPKFRRGPR